MWKQSKIKAKAKKNMESIVCMPCNQVAIVGLRVCSWVILKVTFLL